MAGFITRSGTTGFLIAVPTNTFETYRKILNTLKANPHPAVLGIHLEGPYINPIRKGAHLEELIIKPPDKEIQELLLLMHRE